MAAKTRRVPCTSLIVDSEVPWKLCSSECKDGKAIDLAFILDGSGSIGQTTFESQKAFVNMIIDRLSIGWNSTRVATVQFSDEPVLEFGFDTHVNATSLKVGFDFGLH